MKDQLKHYTDQNNKLHIEQMIVQEKYNEVILVFDDLY